MKPDQPTDHLITPFLPAVTAAISTAPQSPIDVPAPNEAAPLVDMAPPSDSADWQTSVQRIYDRKTAERRTVGEGDPQLYREVAAELSLRQSSPEADLSDDQLIDDSTAIAPIDYQPLSLPNSHDSVADWRGIAGTAFLEHTIVKGDANTQRLDLVFAKVAWQVLNQFGIEAAYVLLLLTTRLARAKDPWNEIVELGTHDLLQLNIWEHDLEMARGQRLRLAGNWFELVCNLSLLINQVNLPGGRFRALRIPLWVIEEMEYGGMTTPTIDGLQQPEAAQDLTIRAGLGLWTEQFVMTRDRAKKFSLLQFGYQASKVLQIDPHDREMAAKLGILLMLLDRLHPDQSTAYAVGALLEAVMPKAALMEMGRRKDRLRSVFARWNTSLNALRRVGWTIEFDDAVYPMTFQPAWHNATVTSAYRQTDRDYWVNDWFRCQIKITPPVYVQTEPDPRDLPLVDRFTGRNLSQALGLKGMAQSKLADELQVDRSMVTYWIKGSRSIRPRHREHICTMLSAELAQVLEAETTVERD